MRLIIQSPAGIEAEAGNIDIIRTVLADGKPLTILPRHASLMGELRRTNITAISRGSNQRYCIKPGILLVRDDVVKVLTGGMQEEENA